MTATIAGRRGHGQGAQGHAQPQAAGGYQRHGRRQRRDHHAGQRRDPPQGAARAVADAGGQHGRGRQPGLHQGPRDPGRRLQGGIEAATASTSSSGSRTRCRSRRRRASSSWSTAPTEVRIEGIDKELVGQMAAEIRNDPAPRAVQGQGRSATWASGSAARPARRERSRCGRFMDRSSARSAGTGATSASASGWPARPAGRASWCIRSLKHIYAQLVDDDRGVALLGVTDTQRGHRARRRRQGRQGARRSASCSPSGPRPPASPRSCSIAADISITVG